MERCMWCRRPLEKKDKPTNFEDAGYCSQDCLELDMEDSNAINYFRRDGSYKEQTQQYHR